MLWFQAIQSWETSHLYHCWGGDQLHYSGDISTPAVGITTTKIDIKSTISTDSTRYLTIDIKDFYLNSDIEEYEYLFIEINLIPPDFAQDYNLQSFSKNGKVLAEIKKVCIVYNKLAK